MLLPQFKLEEYYDLEDILAELGMTMAFDQAAADFSRMSCKRNL